MRCGDPRCLRDDLPAAPAFPPASKVSCAHVNKYGEPCPTSGMYDDETKQIIDEEPKLWDPELRADAPRFLDVKLVEQILDPPDMDKAEREFVTEHGLEDAPPEEIRAAHYKAAGVRAAHYQAVAAIAAALPVDPEADRAAAKALSTHQAKSKPRKLNKRAPKAAEEDVDNWDPEA